jgi:hypothetical protein
METKKRQVETENPYSLCMFPWMANLTSQKTYHSKEVWFVRIIFISWGNAGTQKF